ncbi:MAG: Mu transposase C-terminal domain-containing protein [Candidatus Cloacimonetes bacterium]|nr:Mu transposase C-terminal domain-containing protein [Candidatus Cloacimonadota bacterium]
MKYSLVPEDVIPQEKEPQENSLASVVNAEVVQYDPTIPDLTPQIKIPEHELYRAQLKAELCESVLKEFSKCKVKKAALETVLDAYNSGYFLTDLFNLEGKRTMRTLRMWLRSYEESGSDFKVLTRLSKASRAMKATEIEQNFLLGLLLDANRIKIGSATRKLKQLARLGAIQSHTSERALRRWCENWRDNHIQQWNLLRKGNKHLKDNYLISLLREECLNVGDVWVGDGHKLAFDIIDPVTGRPKRMMLILFFDWASRYPVGASLANTEDSEHILMALRSGILHWKGRPKYVYLDNGKAFKSKLFHEKWEKHDLEKELCGIFPRLDIQVEYAKAYNARAKVIERFFRTFQEDFERYMATFRGASIADKPAFLMRNEKWIRSLKKREPLTIEHAKQLISVYFQEFYGRTPHGGLAGKTPLDVFRKAEVPEDRAIKSAELNFMMLKVEERVVKPNGILLANILYYHDYLMNHVGKKVYLRYDLMDMRSILVYDQNEKQICQALARKSTHPFVKLADNKPIARKQWQKQLAHQKRLEKEVKEKSAILQKQVQEAISEFEMPLINVQQSAFNESELITHQATIDTNIEIDKLAERTAHNISEAPPVPLLKNAEEQGLENLDKILKRIGIE